VNLEIGLADSDTATVLNGLTAGATSVVTVTGSADTTFGAITADSINAAAYTGAITHTADDTLVDTVTYGAGDDSVTATTADTLTLDGGAGTDTLTTGADFTDVTFTNFEVLALGANTDFKVSQLSGQTFIVSGAQNMELDDTTANAIDSTTIDLSGLVINTAEVASTTVVVSAGTISTSIALGNSFTVSGTAVVDNVTLTTTVGTNTVSTGAGDDVILGGEGVDTITGGEGIDTITGDQGADIIILTETVSAVDEVNFAANDEFGDVISGFEVTSDNIDYNVATVSQNDTAGVNTVYLDVTGAHAAGTITGTTTTTVFEFSNIGDALGESDDDVVFDLSTATAAEIKAMVIAELNETAVTASSATTNILFAMYDESGNAAVINFIESGGVATTIDAADTIQVVGILTDVAQGALVTGDFI